MIFLILLRSLIHFVFTFLVVLVLSPKRNHVLKQAPIIDADIDVVDQKEL